MADFLIYGASGFVGAEISRLAVKLGMKPLLAGRNMQKLESLSGELNLEYKVFDLENTSALEEALKEVDAVLHCAGPYKYTSEKMVRACLETKTHYLDITGELSVFESLLSLDEEAKNAGIMILPGVGFDVTPTDCLAFYLKEILPAGTKLAMAFQSEGPAAIPPGTAKTVIDIIPYGNRIRKDGLLVKPPKGIGTRKVDFGKGPVECVLIPWGDVITTFHSTGIPNIEVYTSMYRSLKNQLKIIENFRGILSLPPVLNLLKKAARGGSTKQERDRTITRVWGELTDPAGNSVSCMLHGPESGVEWTSVASLAAVRRTLSGEVTTGFQSPASAFGSSFVFDCDAVVRDEHITVYSDTRLAEEKKMRA